MAKVVRIGHSRIDENGNIANGIAGDQTGKEVCVTDFYMHSYGWWVLRAKDKTVAEKIAKCMEDACANDCIGYDQNQRLTLYNAVKNNGFKCDANSLKVKVESDCSSLVRVCLAYAGVLVQDFYTGNQKDIIMKTGMFECLECEANGDNLKRGDILVSKQKGHTVSVLNDGAKYQKPYYYRVRKSWADAKSQIGAYTVLENAKKACDKNKGYYVFDESGKAIYPQTTTQPKPNPVGIDDASYKDTSLAGTYKVSTALHLRAGANTNKKSLVIMPKDTKVESQGYYNVFNGTKWLLIQCTVGEVKYIGYSSSKYLIKQ